MQHLLRASIGGSPIHVLHQVLYAFFNHSSQQLDKPCAVLQLLGLVRFWARFQERWPLLGDGEHRAAVTSLASRRARPQAAHVCLLGRVGLGAAWPVCNGDLRLA
jgi:hypothetical protein